VVAEADAINQQSGEEVDVIHSGQDYTIAFNPKMLAEALASAPGERVLISFDLFGPKERPRSVNITVPGNQWWRHMLMPLRIL
jgi:DNA polymerase III sliding clamp (beta) subunit (PCNA family)